MNDAAPEYNFLARTRAVAGYQADMEKPGRPLDLLIGGGVLASVSLILIGGIGYRTWYQGTMTTDWAYGAIGLLFVIYTFGVFLFAYGYELYDVAKALRLTLIVALLSVAAIFLFAVLVAALSKLKGGSGGDVEESSIHGGLLRAIGSMAEDRIDDGRRRQEPDDDDDALVMKPFVVSCQACGETFTPAPPRAVCPGCGRSALAAS
jgi:hypothetical protein